MLVPSQELGAFAVCLLAYSEESDAYRLDRHFTVDSVVWFDFEGLEFEGQWLFAP
jgi:hypothetical protein